MATEVELQRKGAYLASFCDISAGSLHSTPRDALPHTELERLLLTAKDKERQEMLRKAIASLDETSAAAAQVVHPSFRSTLMEESVREVPWCILHHNR